MSNDNPVNRMFLDRLPPIGDDDSWRSEMVEVDVDEESDSRLDLMSATEYSSRVNRTLRLEEAAFKSRQEVVRCID